MTPEEYMIFVVDYLPFLKPSAERVYLIAYALKNKDDIVTMSYTELQEHMGMSNPTIKAAIQSLREIGLMKIPQQGNNGPSVASLGRHEVPPIKALSDDRRKILFSESNRAINTRIRSRATDMLPSKYRQLLSKKRMAKALVELGPDNFTLRSVVDHLQMNLEAIKVVKSSPKFKAAFKQLRTDTLNAKVEVKIKDEKLVELKKTKKKKPDTYADKFEQLMSVNIDKEGNEILVENWKPMQLVRYFCVAYRKLKGHDCSVSFSNSIVSKELKHMATILDKVGGDALRVRDYIDWAFKVKDKELNRGGVSTNFLVTGTVINEFNQSKSGGGSSGIKRNDAIDSDYRKWVEENVPEILDQHDFECLNNLFWIKAAFDGGDVDYGEDKVVEEGIKRGILPKKGNLEFSDAK